MTHAQAAEHLREEVTNTARRETGPLVGLEPPAFFGAVRAVMTDMEYVAALYCGWDGRDRRKIATTKKTTRFIVEIVAEGACNGGYRDYGRHLYEMYRVGLVHLRAPKRLRSQRASTPILTWTLTGARGTAMIDVEGEQIEVEHLRPRKISDELTSLPVSVPQLFDDFLAACELFAKRLEEEARRGGNELIERWRSTADALVEPEESELVW